MALPPLHLAVGAACAEVGRPAGFPRFQAWAIGAFIGFVPDIPSAVRLLLGLEAANHGVYSHSLLAVVVAFGVGTALGGLRWGSVFGSAYATHLLVDLLRESGRTSVYLWSPFSFESASPILRLVPHVPFDVFHNGSVFSLHGHNPALGLMIQIGIGAAVLGAAVAFRHLVELRRRDYPDRISRTTHER